MSGSPEEPLLHLRDVVLDPSPELTALVGRIVVHWSFQVWLLQQCTYTMLGLNNAQGRIAVRDPRPHEHIEMLEQLAPLAGFTLHLDLETLKKDLRDLKSLRDSIAHGVWTRNRQTGRLTLQLDSGAWTPPGHREKRSRRHTPEARGVDAEGLESVLAGIQRTISTTDALLRSLEAQSEALPPRPPARPRATGPRPG